MPNLYNYYILELQSRRDNAIRMIRYWQNYNGHCNRATRQKMLNFWELEVELIDKEIAKVDKNQKNKYN